MTTARKVLLIVATALVVTGAVIAGSAFALAGDNMQNLSNDDRVWTRQTQEIPAENVAAIASIEAHDDTEAVRIEGYDGDSIRIEYWEHQRRGVSISQDGGTLSVDSSTAAGPFIGILASQPEDHSTCVYVPHGFAGSILASAESENASIVGFDHLDDAVIETDGGFAIANSFAAKSARMESSNGGVQCNIVTVDGTLQANAAGGGDIVMDSVLADVVRADTTNGYISMSQTSAHSSLQSASKDGYINLHYTDAPETIVASDNGDATLAMPGDRMDYRIDARADNGVVTGQTGSSFNESATRSIAVATTSGNVSLSFDMLDLAEPGTVYQGEALEQILAR